MSDSFLITKGDPESYELLGSTDPKEDVWSKFVESYQASVTDAYEYNLFCKQYAITRTSGSTVENPNEINDAEKAVNHLLSFDFEEISDDSLNFDYSVYKIIKCFGALSITVFDYYLDSEKINHLLAVSLLSFLGRIDDPNTYHLRTILLRNCLEHESLFVREGARLGLRYLMNPKVIPYLEKAIERETSELLKDKLIYTVNALRG